MLKGKFKTGRIYDCEQEIVWSAHQTELGDWLCSFADDSRNIVGQFEWTAVISAPSEENMPRKIIHYYDNGLYI